MNKRGIALIAGIILMTTSAQTQSSLKFSIQSGSRLRLEGNSSMHTYSSKTSDIAGTIIVDSMLFAEGKVKASNLFHQGEITIPVKKMLSGDEKLDNNLYDAIKANDNPNIIYHLLGDSILSEARKDSFTVKTTGTLSVAGKEKNIDMTIMLLKNKDGSLIIRGSKDLLMTDFGIEPPSMMLGLLKTDNKVVIRFDLRVRQQHN